MKKFSHNQKKIYLKLIFRKMIIISKIKINHKLKKKLFYLMTKI